MGHDVLAEKFTLDLDEAKRIFADAVGGEIIDLKPISGGLLNSNFQLVDTQGSSLLRVYPKGRALEEISFEVEVLDALAGSSCRVPRVLADGKVGTVHDRFYVLMEFLEGRTLEEGDIDVDLTKEAGALLGHFHAALAGFEPRNNKQRGDIEYIVGLIAESVNSLDETTGRIVAQYAEKVWAAVGGPEEWGTPDGVVHADYYVENLIRMSSGTLAVIDLDDSYYGTTFFDVAIGAMEFSADEAQRIDGERLDAFIESYNAAFPAADKLPTDRLNDAMLINCLRFMCYTMPLTLEEGEPAMKNPYVQRIDWLLM